MLDWRAVLACTQPQSVLTVGRNVAPAPPRMEGLRLASYILSAAQVLDAPRLPFPDRTFDLVLAVEPWSDMPGGVGWPATFALFDELARVARHYVLLASPATPRYSLPQQIVAWTREWGRPRAVEWTEPVGLAFWRRRPEFAPLPPGPLGTGLPHGTTLFARQALVAPPLGPVAGREV